VRSLTLLDFLKPFYVKVIFANGPCHERAANQKQQSVMIVTLAASDRGIPAYDKY
jgi:hypothetical protein